MSIVWDNSGNCEIFRNKDHDVLVTSMWKEDGGLRWGINRRPLVGYSYRWHPPVCKADSNAYFIIQAKCNFVGYKAPERQRQQGKKTKNNWSVTPLITQFRNTMPPRGQPSARWSWRLTRSSVTASCPTMFNNLYSLQRVGTNFAQNSRCTREKVPAHIRGWMCRRNMSLKHVRATCLLRVYDFAPATFCGNMSLKPVQATCPLCSLRT